MSPFFKKKTETTPARGDVRVVVEQPVAVREHERKQEVAQKPSLIKRALTKRKRTPDEEELQNAIDITDWLKENRDAEEEARSKP